MNVPGQTVSVRFHRKCAFSAGGPSSYTCAQRSLLAVGGWGLSAVRAHVPGLRDHLDRREPQEQNPQHLAKEQARWRAEQPGATPGLRHLLKSGPSGSRLPPMPSTTGARSQPPGNTCGGLTISHSHRCDRRAVSWAGGGHRSTPRIHTHPKLSPSYVSQQLPALSAGSRSGHSCQLPATTQPHSLTASTRERQGFRTAVCIRVLWLLGQIITHLGV